MTYRYKNNTAQDLVIIGRGVLPAGAIVKSETVIENPNLELLDGESVVGIEQPQPNAITEVNSLNPDQVPNNEETV